MNKNGILNLNCLECFKAFGAKSKLLSVGGRDFCSLTYRYSGRVMISSGDAELFSERGFVTYVPRGLPYSTEIIEDTEFFGIHFNIEGADVPSEPVVLPACGGRIKSLFEGVAKPGDGLSWELSRLSMVYELLGELLELAKKRRSGVPEKIRRAEQIIGERFVDPYFSINELCDTLGIGGAYLRREFARAYGVSPIGFLKGLRIRCAKELLLSRKIPISEVAMLSGYSSESYFVQDFGRAVGESPGEYRKRLCFAP